MSDSGVAASERTYDAELRSHAHEFHQILFPSVGRLSLRLGNQPGWVGGGQLAVIAAGVEHAYRADGPNRILVADLPAALFTSADASRPLPGIGDGAFLPVDVRLSSLAASLRTELHLGGLADPLVANALGRYLVAALVRTDAAPVQSGANPAARRLVRSAEDYVRAHFAEPLSVAAVAAAVGASPDHLHRCFRAHGHASIVALVHHLRLERAAALLRDTDLSVLEIAHAVGFASQSHLSRLFNRRYGCPPGRYRASVWPESGTSLPGSGKTEASGLA